MECRHFTPLGLSTCEHSQDAGVRCVGKAQAKNRFEYGLLYVLFSDDSCHLYFQTSMNAALPMEAVNKSVPILLVALPVAVLQDTSWMETDSTALVSNLH